MTTLPTSSESRVSDETPPAETKLPAPDQARPRLPVVAWIAGILLLLGHAPLLVEHFCNMLLRPHYQFVVMLPIGVGLLAWRGLFPDDLDDQNAARAEPLSLRPGHPLLWMPVLLLSLGILTTATHFRSPWLAMLSFLLTTLAFLLFVGGFGLFRRLWPAWLLMWVALPLPQNLDVRLISRLRSVATEWCSGVLDQFGVLHLVSGNVIELPERSLFIADACTGIHSLFVLLAAGLFIGLWMRRSAFHIAILLLSTVGIVLVENVSRISVVAIAVSNGLNWSEGWRHTLLGLVLFVASLLFILSADSLLRLLIPPHLIRRIRRRMSKGRQGDASRDFGDEDIVIEKPTEAAVTEAPVRRPAWLALTPLAVVFVLLGYLQLSWMPTRADQLRQQLRRNPVDFPEFGPAALPDSLDGWRRVDYGVAKRIVEDPMGEHSQAWTYEKDGLRAEVSLDYPYRSLHDLTSCYRGFGWQMRRRTVVGKQDQPEVTDIDPYVVAHMNRPLHGHAFLIYSHYDLAGKCDVELKEKLSMGQLFQKRVDFGLPWFQIQLLSRNHLPVTADEEQQLSDFFFKIREKIVQMCLKTMQENGSDTDGTT